MYDVEYNTEFSGISGIVEKVKYKIFSDRLIIFKGAFEKIKENQFYLLMEDHMKFIIRIGKT